MKRLGIAFDVIWTTRNDFGFNNHRSPLQSLVRQTQSRVDLVLVATNRKEKLSGRSMTDLDSEALNWQRPPPNFYTLNCDASVSEGGIVANCGGLLRNNRGKFIKGYYHKLELCNVLIAEIWAIYHGLKMSLAEGVSNIIVETDCVQAICLLKGDTHPPIDLDLLIRNVHALIPTFS